MRKKLSIFQSQVNFAKIQKNTPSLGEGAEALLHTHTRSVALAQKFTKRAASWERGEGAAALLHVSALLKT